MFLLLQSHCSVLRPKPSALLNVKKNRVSDFAFSKFTVDLSTKPGSSDPSDLKEPTCPFEGRHRMASLCLPWHQRRWVESHGDLPRPVFSQQGILPIVGRGQGHKSVLCAAPCLRVPGNVFNILFTGIAQPDLIACLKG